MTESEIRLQCYLLAKVFMSRETHPPTELDVIAETFVDFVGDEAWKIPALKYASESVPMQTTLMKCMIQANVVADFAGQVKERVPVPPKATTPKPVPEAVLERRKKKKTRKR
jgi:hypothetical protein